MGMKDPVHDAGIVERMQMTFELYEVAETMKRQNVRRRHPELSPAAVEEQVLEWLLDRSGARDGDSEGHWFVVRRQRE